jgi:hypothetical protein
VKLNTFRKRAHDTSLAEIRAHRVAHFLVGYSVRPREAGSARSPSAASRWPRYRDRGPRPRTPRPSPRRLEDARRVAPRRITGPCSVVPGVTAKTRSVNVSATFTDRTTCLAMVVASRYRDVVSRGRLPKRDCGVVKPVAALSPPGVDIEKRAPISEDR